MTQSNVSGQSGVIRLDLTDQNALYEAYMPFIQNGGLFISDGELDGHEYRLGEEVFLFLYLLFEDERMPIAGRVCWKAPRGAHRPAGIGVQFLQKDGGQTQARLETLLADRHNSIQPTQTL